LTFISPNSIRQRQACTHAPFADGNSACSWRGPGGAGRDAWGSGVPSPPCACAGGREEPGAGSARALASARFLRHTNCPCSSRPYRLAKAEHQTSTLLPPWSDGSKLTEMTGALARIRGLKFRSPLPATEAQVAPKHLATTARAVATSYGQETLACCRAEICVKAAHPMNATTNRKMITPTTGSPLVNSGQPYPLLASSQQAIADDSPIAGRDINVASIADHTAARIGAPLPRGDNRVP